MFIHQHVSTNIYRSEQFDTGPRLTSLVYVQIRSYIYITNWCYIFICCDMAWWWRRFFYDQDGRWSQLTIRSVDQRLLYDLDCRFNCTVIVRTLHTHVRRGLDKSPFKCIHPYNYLTRFHPKFHKLITS